MSSNNKRKDTRIPASSLPRELNGFFIVPADEGATKIHTIDASLSGLGFTSAEKPDKFPSGSHLTMYPFGVHKPLKGRVIYKRKEGAGTRVGVQLLSSEGYSTYKNRITTYYKKPE